MADSPAPGPPPALRPRLIPTDIRTPTKHAADDKMTCDRCGGEVYRMHAVWRCAACGYKSDCCGW